MVEVTFYDPGAVREEDVIYVVIVARYRGKLVLVRKRASATWEIPGGHREPGEEPDRAARRELGEETGATKLALHPVCDYAVTTEGECQDGRLYHAEIDALGLLLDTSEIEEVALFDDLPAGRLTYPEIQPVLYRRILAFLADADTPGTPAGRIP